MNSGGHRTSSSVGTPTTVFLSHSRFPSPVRKTLSSHPSLVTGTAGRHHRRGLRRCKETPQSFVVLRSQCKHGSGGPGLCMWTTAVQTRVDVEPSHNLGLIRREPGLTGGVRRQTTPCPTGWCLDRVHSVKGEKSRSRRGKTPSPVLR